MPFTNEEGTIIVYNMIETIQKHKDYLSEIDGAIGDGDHGINMNKGATIAKEELSKYSTLSDSLGCLSQVLMNKIGGSMGPLYGSIFMGMQFATQGRDIIDGDCIKEMLTQAYSNIQMISEASVGDKTLVDVLDPAIHAYVSEYEESHDTVKALTCCKVAAIAGCEATKNMMARIGRAARLGEKSIGHQDAGATSCAYIIEALCDSAIALEK